MSMRSEIDRLKVMWRRMATNEISGHRSPSEIIGNALKRTLFSNRMDPWRSSVICAVFEFAAEEDCQAVFDGVWNQVEVRGDFKCRRTEMPPELTIRSAMMAE